MRIAYWEKNWDYSKNICEQNAKIEGVDKRITFKKVSTSAYFHLVFYLNYRRPIFRYDRIKYVCEKEFEKIANRHDVVIRALKIKYDHVHLFL